MPYDAHGQPTQLVPVVRTPQGLAVAMPVPGKAPIPTEEPESQKIPPGALVRYYSDLASGVIAPEDMRIEDLQFRVQIDPTGQILSETDPIMLIARYQFVLRGITGFRLDPGIGGAAAGLVNFNVNETGRNFTVFKKPVSMASITQGGQTEVRWDGVYITVPGTELEVVWTIDQARWAGLVGTTKEFGVQLVGDYVACAPREPQE